LFVDNDANSMLCNIENPTSLAMVEFEWHTLLEGTIALNVDNVSLLVHLQEGGQGFNTMLLEFLGEQMASTTTISFGVHHFLI
jgi:hypothetical protein